jgi:uncharacterized membrane protein
MSWGPALAHLLLPSAVAVAAGSGAWRCWRLLRYGRDPRLAKLMWFYVFFAASLLSIAIWTGQLHSGDAVDETHVGNLTQGHGDQHDNFGTERIDVFLVAHHVLMLASLGVAVQAFGHRRKEGVAVAAVGFALLGPFVPVVLAIEAAMTLYLAVQAILNHMERRSPGALQVAAGFFLFFLGHLSYFLFHQAGAARTPLGDVLALVGIVLLVQLLPRPST